MPESNIYIEKKSNKKKYYVSLLVPLIIFLFLALIISTSTLVYFIKNPSTLKTVSNIVETPKIDNSMYAALDDYKCRDESEYNNSLTVNSNVEAYPRKDFYSLTLDKKDVVSTILNTETLYTELIMWEDEDKELLEYTGRALVCIKGKDKLATILFTTKNSKFAYPVRYKDPEKSIQSISIQAFYMVPKDATIKSDWKTKMENNLKNIQTTQKRIFNNGSTIEFKIYPEVIKENDLSKNFLTQIAKGIVTKDKNNEVALTPVNYLDKNIYTELNLQKYPDFDPKSQVNKKYNQISSLVYYEVGDGSIKSSNGNESGYAFINPALDNGNYFAIIGTNLNRDISLESSSYHEFMHTLGLPDEYAYKDGSLQREPTHFFKGQKQTGPTLMQDPGALNLSNTYIDDQERILMGVEE